MNELEETNKWVKRLQERIIDIEKYVYENADDKAPMPPWVKSAGVE